MQQPARTPSEALEAVLQIAFGGVAARMAEACGVSDQTISWWRHGRNGRPVKLPSDYCPMFERRTREQGRPVLCEELRPDLAEDWAYLRLQAGEPDAAEQRATT